MALPGTHGELLISVDTAWNVLKQNTYGDDIPGVIGVATLSAEQVAAMGRTVVVAKIESSGSVSVINNSDASLPADRSSYPLFPIIRS